MTIILTLAIGSISSPIQISKLHNNYVYIIAIGGACCLADDLHHPLSIAALVEELNNRYPCHSWLSMFPRRQSPKRAALLLHVDDLIIG